MKTSKRFLALLLTAVMVASVMVTGVVSVSAAEASISYTYAQSDAGYAEGTITLTPSSGYYGTYYLFWADDTDALKGYKPIDVLNISSGSGTVKMPAQTVIPPDATKIVAFLSKTDISGNTTILRVSDAEAVYNIPESRRLGFNTDDALYTFGAISDPQLANDSYGSGSYPNDEDHLTNTFNVLGGRDVDFIVSSGDTVNDQNGNQTYAAEYKRYLQILADSQFSKPIYEALGNHDVGTVWNKTGGYYNNNEPFIKATGLDSTAETILAGKPYFEVTEPTTGDHFIFMALEGGFYTNKGTQFSTAQLDWLEGLLKKYSTDGKNIFIIEHANIAGWGSGDKLTAPYYYDLALNPDSPDVARFISLMETYKECVIITGHTHLELSAQYNYSDNNGTSAVMMHNSAVGGVRRLVNGAIDRTPVAGLSEGYLVEVYEDCIIFNGMNTSSDRIMPLCSYIIPFDTEAINKPAESESATAGTDPIETTTEAETSAPAESTAADATEATTNEVTEATSETPAETITITLKSSGSATDWVLNSDSRVVTLIDNATGTEYTATLTSEGWVAEVPADVQDITFHRVKNGAVSHTWLAGNRGSDVNYYITGDARGHWENEVVPEYADVYLPGSFNSWDQTDAFEKTSDANVVTRTLELSAGTYTFKVMEGSTWLGNGGTIQNTTTTTSSGGWVMSANDGNCTLVATGGVYTFNFDTSTNKLIVLFSENTKAVSQIAAIGADATYIIGDADLDEAINIKDATLIQKHSASLVTLEGVALIQADVTADDAVNIKDATEIQKFVAGLIDKFPANDVNPSEPATTDSTEGTTPAATEDTTEESTPAATEETTEETTATPDNPGAIAQEYELAGKYLSTYYMYSSYNQYMALKDACFVSDGDFNYTVILPQLEKELEDFILSIGGELLDLDAPAQSDEITVYFTNNYNWSTVKAYVWGTAGSMSAWPGTAMTYADTNNQSQKIYSITFSYADYQNIIFTDGSSQTADIALSGDNNVGYYISGESSGKYTCSTYNYS
ncbi:MAG: starch-binding protein [Ruminococcus sp.]|nr:starch-binding protein [Ruminococcus sp.]